MLLFLLASLLKQVQADTCLCLCHTGGTQKIVTPWTPECSQDVCWRECPDASLTHHYQVALSTVKPGTYDFEDSALSPYRFHGSASMWENGDGVHLEGANVEGEKISGFFLPTGYGVYSGSIGFWDGVHFINYYLVATREELFLYSKTPILPIQSAALRASFPALVLVSSSMLILAFGCLLIRTARRRI